MAEYRTHEQVATFVEPHPAPAPVVEVEAHEITPADIGAVWAPTESRLTADSISAKDRAVALNMRLLPLAALAMGVAMLGVLLFVAAVTVLGLPAIVGPMFDRVLVFLLAMVVVFWLGWRAESDKEWMHSHAGVERHRISTAAEVYRTKLQLDADIAQKRLETSLKLIGVDDYDTD